MDHHRTRIVVGEGQTLRKGLLRFVLEGEGYDVVAEAGSSAELARMVAVHEPDAVVLDDGIGATAVQMARELAPKAKVILVWPGAVVPIGGDARVEPAEVLKELGAAVQKVTARPAPSTETFKRPAWVDRVRKDPATLRELLEKSGGLPRRPSVTELQRRGQRLHPVGQPDESRSPTDRTEERSPDAGKAVERTDGASTDDTRPEAPAQPPGAGAPPPDEADRPAAPVVILPVPGAGRTDEPILVVGSEPAAEGGVAELGAAPGEPAGGEETPATPTEETTRAPEVAAGSAAPVDRRGAAVIPLSTATPTRTDDDAATEWNRRLGSIALGGAAVAGALVLALSLGGSRIPADVLAADPPFVAGADAPEPFDGDTGIADPDGIAGPVPAAPTLATAPVVVEDTTPTRNDTSPPAAPDDPDGPPGGQPEPPGGEPEPPGGEPEPPNGEPEPPNGGELPGASARNPHGGPPGLTGNPPETPGNGGGNGGGNPGGNGNGNGPPAEPPGQGHGHGPGGVAGNTAPGHAHKR